MNMAERSIKLSSSFPCAWQQIQSIYLNSNIHNNDLWFKTALACNTQVHYMSINIPLSSDCTITLTKTMTMQQGQGRAGQRQGRGRLEARQGSGKTDLVQIIS